MNHVNKFQLILLLKHIQKFPKFFEKLLSRLLSNKDYQVH